VLFVIKKQPNEGSNRVVNGRRRCIISLITKHYEANEVSWKPHKGLPATSQPPSETKQWLTEPQRGRKLEDANCKWNDFSFTHSKVVSPLSASIEATYVCEWAYTLTWRPSWWLYGLYTQICNMKASVRNESRWTKCMTNTSQKYSQRICDLTLLNHLHDNAEWSRY